ncbi:MAG: DUF2608 domain-containing protein [Parachlamydiaceae bacterium]|nr:DUF2608 domain-containing protein [Parachlamydiaceae bacterium]
MDAIYTHPLLDQIGIHLLKQINHFPQKVLFVDDKLNHVQSLEGPLAELNIDYIGVRYSKADERVQEFDAQIADLQMKHFLKFISDEEAREMLSPA